MDASGVQNERHGRSLGSRVCLSLFLTSAFDSSQATPLIMTRFPHAYPTRAVYNSVDCQLFKPFSLSIKVKEAISVGRCYAER